MVRQPIWADRGESIELGENDEQGVARCCGISRLANLRLASPSFSLWMQIRGVAHVDAKEGRFHLAAGDWIALERHSRPRLQTGRTGLTLGLTLPAEILRALESSQGRALFAGRGRMPPSERGISLRLWRQAAGRLARHDAIDAGQTSPIEPLLLHLSALQRDLTALLDDCPGRSRGRKHELFGRLQRARLFLEGNSNRAVSLTEVSKLTHFSSWHLSKTFHSTYGESLQAASRRLRMERAGRMLVDTTLTIEEIAAACGFESPCSFARAFRSHYAMTATQYRSSRGSSFPASVNLNANRCKHEVQRES